MNLTPWAKLPKELMRKRSREIPWTAKGVFCCILDRIGQNGESWPGVRTIAHDCGIDEKTVMDAIERLVNAGLLQVEVGQPARAGKAARSNRYSLPSAGETPAPSGNERGSSSGGESPARAGNPPAENLPQNETKHRRPTNKIRREKDGEHSSPKPPVSADAVGIWSEIYAESRGQKPGTPSKRDGGTLTALLGQSSSEDFRRRLRIAAGLDGPAPWPFDGNGELTIGNLKRHWDRLGDAARTPHKRLGRVAAPPGKYANAGVRIDGNIRTQETPGNDGKGRRSGIGSDEKYLDLERR